MEEDCKLTIENFSPENRQRLDSKQNKEVHFIKASSDNDHMVLFSQNDDIDNSRRDSAFDRFRRRTSRLLYSVVDMPSWPAAILFAFQQIVVCASGLIAIPLVVSDLLCSKNHPMARVNLMGTTMVVSGVATFLQSGFGVRLPLLQGPSYSFVPAIVAMSNIPEFQCPTFVRKINSSENTTSMEEIEFMENLFRSRMQVIQGTFVAAAAFEMFIGITGLVGFITKFVGPLTVVPLMLCLELSAAQFTVEYVSKHWISAVTIILLLITALYMQKLSVPIPSCSRRGPCFWKKFPVFSVFSYLIAIFVVWMLCVILTVSNAFSKEYDREAKTDYRSQVLTEAPWFRMPYPGQWGPLKFHMGVFLGTIAATIASVIESLGDYHACARACRQTEPPSHAVNRGILIEGISCALGGFVGAAASVTTYSEAVGVIGITKVASRRTMQLAGVVFIFFGLFTKFGAILATIPDPIVGGILTLSCATIGGVGLGSLKSVDTRSSRNLVILGFAFFAGVLIPGVISKTPFRTGYSELDGALNVLFSIQMFVAGITGFILDNTVPWATREQRGLSSRYDEARDNRANGVCIPIQNVYGFGPRATRFFEKIPGLKYLPFMPPSTIMAVDEGNDDL